MTDKESLSRKKKVRAGHRASVTRMIDAAGELLSLEGRAEPAKLRQRREALAAKAEVLRKLDEEMVEEIHEDDLEGEIESADAFRERIELAIIELDGALKATTDAATDKRRVTSLPKPTETRAADDPSSREASPRIVTSPSTDPPRDSTSPHRHEPEDPLHMRSVDGDSPGTRSHTAEHMLVHHSPHVKLPKLSLKKFNGDLTKWTTFWDAFESAVHKSPALTNIDKFSYLISLLESTAAEAIAGLKLTSANYEEAVATLRRRFGNKQLIINRHMDLLLQLDSVTSTNNLKGLRRLFDAVESNVRGLRSLGVLVESYGGLLSSILMSRLPQELRLIVSRELHEEEWKFETMMEIFQREIEARERSAGTPPPSFKRQSQTNPPPTALSLTAGASTQIACVYCGQPHASDACQTVRTPQERKQVLRANGRCFVCLRRNHISRNCRSSRRCSKCNGRHHVSTCSVSTTGTIPMAGATSTAGPPHPTTESPRVSTTSSMCVCSSTPILLQTAKATVSDATQPEPATPVEARVILDTGSQRSYVTTRVCEALRARKSRTELMVIKTFGSEHGQQRDCDIVQLKFATRQGEPLVLPMVVVPHICGSVCSQPIDTSKASYRHLTGLDLADAGHAGDNLEIDLLIGSDHYWKLVTGRVLKGVEGPTAIETQLGWVLSGPAEGLEESTIVNFVSVRASHVLRIDHTTEQESLDVTLRRFWELESLGILKEDHPVQEKFSQHIKFDKDRYEVHLPWKDSHLHLPDNYDLCKRRLTGLLKRLRQNPEQLQLYDSIIRDQLRQGIVEEIKGPSDGNVGRLHYLPHHPVLRQDSETTKVRVVYDASARTDGPSLNDCLHTGPKFGQSILDILLRFRLHKVALIGDIERAFLMISVARCDRDVLRFLWVSDTRQPNPEITVLRFTRVVFGVSASPFLLNATIDHHMKKIETTNYHFVDKFRRSIYVDDIVTSAATVEDAYQFYERAKSHLAKASFNLRKFESNSSDLRQKINEKEHLCNEQDLPGCPPVNPSSTPSKKQVLGILWDPAKDVLVFDIREVSQLMKGSCPTKRNVISLAARFYDPLGVIAPITIRFKRMFQQLCERSIDWDELLTGDLLTEWETLTSDLQQYTPLQLPRCCTQALVGESSANLFSLQGYCDASQGAYAAVVYLQVGTDDVMHCQFLCSKTRVAPAKKITIPRLELLSAFLLARLISTVRQALESEIQLSGVTCYTDSQVVYFWITRREREWKQFVQNRVDEIRKIVPPDCWKHCPGDENPADIPSRGVPPLELSKKLELWLHGPRTLRNNEEPEHAMTMPEDCLTEAKVKDKATSLLNAGSSSSILPCQDYSSFKKLLRVTAYVFKFIANIKSHSTTTANRGQPTLTAGDIEMARTYWLKASQEAIADTRNFQQWSVQFGLFQDQSGLWRCGGRLGNSDLPQTAKHPVLLDKGHHVTLLIVRDSHERVLHGGVKATLTELRSRYWIIQGRSFVRRILQKCTVCRRFQGRPYLAPPAPPLPVFRVNEAQPFTYTGVDYAGPLYIRNTMNSSSRKVWLCLFTCCVTRAIHLDVVPDMTAEAFLRCFKRFTSRRGFPTRVVSDNAKTFKAASRLVKEIMEKPVVTNYFSGIGLKWVFNLERAPWWGGFFERLIQMTKRCLRKVLKNARLTYEELLTSVVEVEMTLNSRPLSFVSSEDVEEPLTPSHLLCGHRIQSLPDHSSSEEETPYEVSISHRDLTKRMKYLGKILSDFWKRWRSEYLIELREAHRHPNLQGGVKMPINTGDIVVVHDENLPRGLWKLGRVGELIVGADGNIRSAEVQVSSRGIRPATLRRPIRRLYPLEFSAKRPTSDQGKTQIEEVRHAQPIEATPEPTESSKERPRRRAFIGAQDKMRSWCNELSSD